MSALAIDTKQVEFSDVNIRKWRQAKELSALNEDSFSKLISMLFEISVEQAQKNSYCQNEIY
jgi:hypothetical protein